MKSLLLLICLVSAAFLNCEAVPKLSYELLPYDPVADAS